MAEKHLDYNPFAYTANNPFHHGNPDGRDIIPFTTILNQFNKLNVNHKDPCLRQVYNLCPMKIYKLNLFPLAGIKSPNENY